MLSKALSMAALSATAFAASNDASNHWAVLVAGSNTYSNYRHQADVCHAYQIMKKNGIPEDQIILLSYDDVAHHWRNPFKGKLFNKPSPKGTPGEDVYAGCKIDYRHKDVTAETLTKVLKGDTSLKGKVLKSDADSKVFFYFADHGAPGLIAMPVGKPMYADKLHDIFTFMHANDMFGEMTVYIEACESGSMFENILEDNLNIYAVTAANSTESSWGTYCSPNDSVDGKKIRSCLGDLFSVNWMEDSDKGLMSTESLADQYVTVQGLTTKSEVLQWGQTTFTDECIGHFQGGEYDEDKASPVESLWSQIKTKTPQMIKDLIENNEEIQAKTLSAVDSRDIDLHFWYNLAVDEPTEENLKALQDYITYRKKVDSTVEAIFGQDFMSNLEGNESLPTDFECYRNMIEKFQSHCFEQDGYNLKYYKAFVAHCEFAKNFPEGQELVQKTLDKIEEVCKQ